jgi:hypothetical protein
VLKLKTPPCEPTLYEPLKVVPLKTPVIVNEPAWTTHCVPLAVPCTRVTIEAGLTTGGLAPG